ncbi:PP2C family protein-serine/threonine phosphatase [Mycoplasmopsis lipofaciens]|uniref:PP2C family protein-serine/threonine phosphatase n=1 Tax=Mycoplasmopsis lipofaciens TaxID=114884 RepID=UPI00047FACBC|nr:protein phosphatase 2C domain-containing protein [Mycoplasmopsis lipofaciens]
MNFGTSSHVGNVRLENQDRVSVLTNNNYTFLILCDGMGGHFGGAIASTITIKVFNQALQETIPSDDKNIDSYVEWFKNTINKARNKMIIESQNDEAKLDMGTTVTAALINKKTKKLIVFNIGDSRTYVLTTDGDLRQITTDHNLLNKQISEGKSEAEALKNPFHAALTSALGPEKRIKIEVFDLTEHYDKVHSILATSDGVHDFIQKMAIEQILKENDDANEICTTLTENAMQNNSTDNVSAGLVVLDNQATWK